MTAVSCPTCLSSASTSEAARGERDLAGEDTRVGKTARRAGARSLVVDVSQQSTACQQQKLTENTNVSYSNVAKPDDVSFSPPTFARW